MMLTSLSESVVDMLCSCPPSLQVLIVGLCRGKEFHPKENGASAGAKALTKFWRGLRLYSSPSASSHRQPAAAATGQSLPVVLTTGPQARACMVDQGRLFAPACLGR